MVTTTQTRELRVLLIEDDDNHAALISRLLDRVQGFSHSLRRAERLTSGLAQLHSNPFDAILLDLNLPDSTGIDTCNRICAEAPQLPVIVMTSLAMPPDGVQLVRNRVEDYLSKGELNGELMARAITCAVERAGRRRAERERDRFEDMLAAAQSFQSDLLPSDPPRLDGFDIAAASWPADVIAGDYFDFLATTDRTLGIAVGDAVGHGPGAAMLRAVATGCVRTSFGEGTSLDSVLTHANRVIEHFPPDNSMMTLMLVHLDADSRSFTYASAGHALGFVFDRGWLRRPLNGCNGIPLGLASDSVYSSSGPVQLAPGECLLLVSDGVIESRNSAGDYFWISGIERVLSEHPDATAAELVAAVAAGAEAFRGGRPAEDDVTVVAVRSLG